MLTPPNVTSAVIPLSCCNRLWISSNMFDPTMLTSSIIINAKFDNFAVSELSLSWLSGWKPVYLLVPSSSAECNVMPLMLNAATPVGAVSNTMTSSGSKAPNCLRNLIVSECIDHMT